MKPEEVINRVVEADTWKDSVWVNSEYSTFFVPIWRNGNTTFMNRIAQPLGFELVKQPDLFQHHGITFLRDPAIRLGSQLIMAEHNTGASTQTLLDNINHLPVYDEHLIKQTVFVKPYRIKSYIDLDNRSEYKPKTQLEASILSLLDKQHDFKSTNTKKADVQIIIDKDINRAIVEEYMQQDQTLFDKFANT
jgi:hypothetical protein